MSENKLGQKYISYIMTVLFVGVVVGLVVMLRNQLFERQLALQGRDPSFGWKIPVAQFQPGGRVTGIDAYSSIRDPGGVARGLPVRLKIPIINVDTAIEDAYITPDGRMDVPAGSVNVAWYALGPRPGQVGSAVIGGHFGIKDNIPFVFYDLDKLKVGDKAYIVDDKGETLAFVAKSIRLFGRNDDATPVFLSGDGLAHLNVITCEGIWNKVNDTYPDRRVVFMDAIPSEGEIAVAPRGTVAPKPIPSPSISPTTTDLPATAISEPATPSIEEVTTSQTFLTTLRNLYATPSDGLITTTLLLLIFYVLYKIIIGKKRRVAKRIH